LVQRKGRNIPFRGSEKNWTSLLTWRMRKLAGTVAEDEEMKLLQDPSRRRCAGGCGCPRGAGARAGLGEEDAPSEGERRRERWRLALGLGRRMRQARASGGESGGGWMRTAEKPGTDEQLY